MMKKHRVPEADRKFLGAAIVNMRQERGLSTEELSERSGVPLSLLGRIENGEAEGDEWGLREICAVSAAMDVAAHEIMERWERYAEEAGTAWWQAAKREN
jgi:transcriptional regulator with XRE-family HTH domain